MDQTAAVFVFGDWENGALCRMAEADLFFPQGPGDEARAKALCRSCPVRWSCLAYALKNRVEHGVWGGLSDRERRRILNREVPETWNPESAMRAVS
jgi:WhiB family redox-sensing transcriptional regulator